MIRSRVDACLAYARAEGKHLGRRRPTPMSSERIQAQLTTGTGIIKSAKTLGVGVGTVHRIKRELAAVVG
jgi:DNA invertase Pin-like site-specific DNA recombinase